MEIINKKKALMVIVLLGLFFLLLNKIGGRRFCWQEPETITVVGGAKIGQKNQNALFSVGVDAVMSDKEKAVKEVNKKIEEIIKSVKDFGILEQNIKTQNISIYQEEEYYYEGGIEKSRKGQWRVNSSIDIKLNEIDKVSDFLDLLTSSGANNVYGPNFSIEDTDIVKKDLYQAAMEDANEKATLLSSISGRKIGRIVKIVEGDSNSVYPLYHQKTMEGMGGDSSFEAGFETVSQNLTVVFELK